MGAPTDAYARSMRLFDLPVSGTSAWIFNCYVIQTQDGLVVVDPGLPMVAGLTMTMIREDLDRSPTDVASVLCTHGHPDHVAGVTTLTGSAPCTVHLPGRCAAYLDGETPRTFSVLDATKRFMSVYREQRFSAGALVQFANAGRRVGFGGPSQMTLDFVPDGFVDDGDVMPAAPGWEVIHAPGHTDDSTCLYHADSATLISGDAVVTQDGRPWFNPEYVDRATSAETEERLRSLPVAHLLPGHGRPISATDIWSNARSFDAPPTGRSLLARCSRRLGSWP
jgi:glyoxylase-like metal-dependent hydrolase (beta-lactamase superfamily II)